MSKHFGVVILSRFPEFAEKLIKSIRATHEEMPSILVVRDRNDATYGDDVEVIDGKEPFVFARNANIGLMHFGNKDVILCNDDLECLEDDFFYKLHAISLKYPLCALLSPLIKGGVGNPLQDYSNMQMMGNFPSEVQSNLALCFPCIVIKRKIMDIIGYLDENFTGYGGEDQDYSIRTRDAGYAVMVTKLLHIQHGDGGVGLNKGLNFSLSFDRDPRGKSSVDYLLAKHGLGQYA